MPTASRSASVKAKHRAPVKEVRKAINTSTMAAAALVPVDKPLTEMQKKFIKGIAEGESVDTAMKRAGYNDQPSYGYRILKMPNAQALLQQYQREYAQVSQMTKKKVMDMHMEAYEMAKLMAEPATMVSAAREIGKMCGFYEPKKIDININGSTATRRLEQMDSDDLERLIKEAESAQAAMDAASSADLPLLERDR